jgi:hypothetical protein
MARWHRLSDWQRRQQPAPPGKQVYEAAPYKAEIVAPALDTGRAAAELQHAREQIALAGQYPGRERSLPADRDVIGGTIAPIAKK